MDMVHDDYRFNQEEDMYICECVFLSNYILKNN